MIANLYVLIVFASSISIARVVTVGYAINRLYFWNEYNKLRHDNKKAIKAMWSKAKEAIK